MSALEEKLRKSVFIVIVINLLQWKNTGCGINLAIKEMARDYCRQHACRLCLYGKIVNITVLLLLF